MIAHNPDPCHGNCQMFLDQKLQGCIKLLDFSLSSIGWRRGLGRGGAFLFVSPLLGPLPTRSSRGEDGELAAALGRRVRFGFVAVTHEIARWPTRREEFPLPAERGEGQGEGCLGSSRSFSSNVFKAFSPPPPPPPPLPPGRGGGGRAHPPPHLSVLYFR